MEITTEYEIISAITEVRKYTRLNYSFIRSNNVHETRLRFMEHKQLNASAVETCAKIGWSFVRLLCCFLCCYAYSRSVSVEMG